MATRALIGFLDDDKQLVGTYNHYDGYPDGLGKTLVKHFNDGDAAEKLAATGYISSIDPESGDIDSKYNQEIIPKEKLNYISLKENDNLEIVSFVGGG